MNGHMWNESFTMPFNSTLNLSELCNKYENSTDKDLKPDEFVNRASGPVNDNIWITLIIIK